MSDVGLLQSLGYVLLMAYSSPPGEIRVQKDNSLDFEASAEIHLVVLADSGLQTAHCRVSISLLDVNDNAPVFEHSSYRTAVWEGQVHNTYIMQVDVMNIKPYDIRNTKQVYHIFSCDDWCLEVIKHPHVCRCLRLMLTAG